MNHYRTSNTPTHTAGWELYISYGLKDNLSGQADTR